MATVVDDLVAGVDKVRLLEPSSFDDDSLQAAMLSLQQSESALAVVAARFLAEWQGIDRSPPGGAGVDRLREVLIPLQGIALTPETWERDVLPRRVGAYSTTWLDELCASGEVVWVGAGALGRSSHQ